MKTILFKTLLLGLTLTMTLSSFVNAEEEEVVIPAEMTCNVYNTNVVAGKLKDSQLLMSVKGQAFKLGYAQMTKTPLPAPYEGVSIVFNHFNTFYNETGPETKTPFIQAYFNYQNKDQSFSRSNFDIKNPTAGSRIILRSTLSYSKESMLSYQCFLTFL